MGDFNLELLQKFRKFKTEKFSEQDRIREDQENKFKNYISVSEEVSEYLHSSIWELKTQVKDLKKELVSLRATKDDQSKVYQKRLLEEEQKVEVLKLRLKIEKERTRSQANEIDSLRAAKDEEIMECRKLLMEEKQKNKELSDENERLKQLQEKLISSRLKNTKDAQLCITTTGGHVSRETTKHTKRSGGRKINIPRA
ncbi:PREDICTED: golgin subfamily A member 6-like protein 1 [Fragaria vesca subsp. vesca]|uniref:golgin subfamily A member 6-like protein 1 n=1 Tax=Fragaria vesca subsp. vesca TaxID=101020 RepID=UPI0002C34C50|nr:PREDICTED: golgin subfamily A member 6-like protein 1 [Fragaria vesca subsp. vesca]